MIQPDDSIITVGMSDGLMSVQKRREEVDEVKRRKSSKSKRPFYASLVKKELVLDSVSLSLSLCLFYYYILDLLRLWH